MALLQQLRSELIRCVLPARRRHRPLRGKEQKAFFFSFSAASHASSELFDPLSCNVPSSLSLSLPLVSKERKTSLCIRGKREIRRSASACSVPFFVLAAVIFESILFLLFQQASTSDTSRLGAPRISLLKHCKFPLNSEVSRSSRERMQMHTEVRRQGWMEGC